MKARSPILSFLRKHALPDTISQASIPAHMMICHQCDLQVSLQTLMPGMEARCPRCKEHLCAIAHEPYLQPIAWAISTLCFLILSCCFPFLAMNIKGNISQISLLQSAEALVSQDFSFLANLLLLFVLLMPSVFLFGVIYTYQGLRKQRLLPGMMFLAKVLKRFKPWMMVDIFFFGILVSMVKLVSYATLSMGWSFWALLCFTITLTRTASFVDSHWLYAQIFRLQKLVPESCESSAKISCHACGFLSPNSNSHCMYCQAKLHHRRPYSLQITFALLVASAILYFPANLYPMMLTEYVGSTTSSTILQGVILLWDLHSYPVAMVIFIASICIPIAKMISLSLLCLAALRSRYSKNPVSYTKLYRVTEFIGRWSMVDVFVVSILVAIVHMGSLMSIYPGAASLSFATVVILTMLAAMSFDVRLIWDRHNTENTHFKQENNNGK